MTLRVLLYLIFIVADRSWSHGLLSLWIVTEIIMLDMLIYRVLHQKAVVLITLFMGIQQ